MKSKVLRKKFFCYDVVCVQCVCIYLETTLSRSLIKHGFPVSILFISFAFLKININILNSTIANVIYKTVMKAI